MIPPLPVSVPASALDRCWQRIGIWGDRACPELRSVIHCRNCPLYTQAGRGLLEREISEDVLSDWNQAKEFNALQFQASALSKSLSMVVFRLQTEWFALSTAIFKEVTPITTVRAIPHRTNSILTGIINVRGELQLCVSLTTLLDLQPAENQSHATAHSRFLVIEQELDPCGICEAARWVFPADEIDGIHHFPSDTLTLSPSAIAHTSESYTKGILHWRDRTISVLDEELLFYRLSHKVLK
jgi:chemotaxis-related protein WspD